MKAVMIGAGQIGRGFIGMLLEQSGYHVVFADVDMDVIHDINTRKEYTVHLVDTECVDTTVKNISAIYSGSPELIAEYSRCDLICTSVGLGALPAIAPALAKGVAQRYASGVRSCLNIIACENAVRCSSQLKQLLLEYLSPEETDYLEKYIGFPDCAVDRIIPPAKGLPAAEVVVERYHEWDVEKAGFKGEVPAIKGMNVVDDITAYLERKLFMLNGPNAVTAFYGYLKGYKTINDAIKDEEIRAVVTGMMKECGNMLCLRHGFSPQAIDEYRESLLLRFQNPFIIDDCLRVAREPARKLSPPDRIIAPMNHAQEYGINTPSYYTGVALGYLFDYPGDRQSWEIREMIQSIGVAETMEKISGIVPGSRISEKILAEYNRLAQVFLS